MGAPRANRRDPWARVDSLIADMRCVNKAARNSTLCWVEPRLHFGDGPPPVAAIPVRGVAPRPASGAGTHKSCLLPGNALILPRNSRAGVRECCIGDGTRDNRTPRQRLTNGAFRLSQHRAIRKSLLQGLLRDKLNLKAHRTNGDEPRKRLHPLAKLLKQRLQTRNRRLSSIKPTQPALRAAHVSKLF